MKCAIFILPLICAALAAPPVVDEPVQLLSLGNRQFTAAVYKEILKTEKGNLIFSPFSAETVLALTCDGAKGDTRKELIAALHLSESQEKTHQAFKEILPKLKLNNEKVKLLSANKIYADHNVALENDFKKIAVEIYESGVENINFGKNVEAANTINQWVEKQTNERIKDLIKPDQIDAQTALVLVNALYLSAKWETPFPSVPERKEKFYKTATETVELPTMSKVDYFNYYENKELNAQFLELKYEADDLSMNIVLPNEKQGLTTLESNVEKVFEPVQWTGEIVDLKLPKFTINSDIKFVDILKSLGVNKIFKESEADLTGLSSNRKNLYVSGVVQKAFINVTEGGTEAAAATAVLVQTRSGHAILPANKIFHVDHPFIYTIKYKDIILFAGKYTA